MEFYTSSDLKRPIRLSEKTRQFAYESLNHKYGLNTRETPSVSLNHIENFENMSELEKYDVAIHEIVTKAPVRICENEKISGAATLGMAISHTVPAHYNDSELWHSISHLTIDFETVLKKGVNFIRDEVDKSLKKYAETEKETFLKSCAHCINCMEIYRSRYLEELKNKDGYEHNYENLKLVPFEPATNFYEAVQSIWFTFAFVRLCGNWPGIGRIDWLLGNYLENDLNAKRITLDEAREILAHFFIKGCEWVCGGDYGSGDAQHYQNILLAGIDENGNEVTNTVTYLVLDILEELGISDFPTTIRINKNTETKLLKRIAEVIRFGGGIIAVYNEELIIESLTDYGYSLTEARKFANDGCWEIQIPGKTYFIYQPFDSLTILQQDTLNGYSNVSFESFENLYDKYINDLRNRVNQLKVDKRNVFLNSGVPTEDWKWKSATPCTVVSLFEGGCVEKGLSYLEGGPVYNVVSPHIGGLPDTINSLYAIKKLVFDDKKVSFKEFMEILKNNWEGHEQLRRIALNGYTYFGNDNDEVDEIGAHIVNDFADICDDTTYNSKFMTPAGISTFGRQLEWSKKRLATPNGKKAHDILSGNYSPTPGTDKEGSTAIIRSYCKSNLKRTVSGAALDIKLLPTYANSENGIPAIISLIKGFVELGGHFMQLDIADAELLKKAQEQPEDYQNLSVRVSGWNARFVTMNKEWQDMVIERSK